MKISGFIICVAILLSFAGYAQPNGKFEEWGKVTNDDLNVKECSFEKNPDMILLLDLAQVYYSKDGGGFFSATNISITTSYYQRYKILTETGTKKADFKMQIRPANKEKITGIRAICYNPGPDGQMIQTVLLPEDIHQAKLNAYQDEITFTVPGVRPGSVFEINYSREQNVSYTLPSWTFTSYEPSLKSSLTVGFLDIMEYYQYLRVPVGEVRKTSHSFTSDIRIPEVSLQELDGNAITYTETNIPQVHSEPFMNSMANYMDRIEFQLKAYHIPGNASPNRLIHSWFSLNSKLMENEYFANGISGTPIGKRQLKSVVSDNMNAKDKLRAIYDYVRGNMETENSSGIFPNHSTDETWKQKTGSVTDINLLLIGTLNQYGIHAMPMIVTTRNQGYMNTDYPMLNQFYSVLAMVELDSQKIVLDASDKFLPFGVIGYRYLDNTGYVMKDRNSYYWHSMFNTATNTDKTYITASIDGNNSINGEIESTLSNYSAAEYRRLKDGKKETDMQELTRKRMPNVTIEAITDTFDARTELYQQTVKFNRPAVADNDGNLYISIADIYGETNNPFVNQERISDVDFGYKPRYETVLELNIPNGYDVDSLFQPTEMRTSDTSVFFRLSAEVIGKKVLIKQRLIYRQSFYDVRNYAAFYEFQQKYYKRIQQPIVLKRRKQ